MNVIALNVNYDQQICGVLAKVTFDDGSHTFMFQYAPEYLMHGLFPISLSLPKRELPYYSNELFGCFDNMIAEGWLKKEQSKMLRIDEHDHFSLLLNNGEDLPGAVTVHYDEKLSDLLEADFNI